MKSLIHSQTSTAALLEFGKWFHTTLYNGCNSLSKLGLKSISIKGVSCGMLCRELLVFFCCCFFSPVWPFDFIHTNPFLKICVFWHIFWWLSKINIFSNSWIAMLIYNYHLYSKTALKSGHQIIFKIPPSNGLTETMDIAMEKSIQSSQR